MSQSFSKVESRGGCQYYISEYLHEEGVKKPKKDRAQENSLANNQAGQENSLSGATDLGHHPAGYYIGDDAEISGVAKWFDPHNVIGRHGQAVISADFLKVCEGFHPDYSEGDPGDPPQKRQNAGKKKQVFGYDFCYSVPKPVSVLQQLGDEDTKARIQKIVENAVDEALKYAGDELFVTRRGSGSDPDRKKENCRIIAAKFPHLTNRHGKPQTHIHAFVSNLTQREDGTFGAVDTAKVLRYQGVTKEIFHAAVAKGLAEEFGLEIEIRPGKEAFFIKNLPPEIEACADLFSTRRKQMLEKAGGQEALIAGGKAFEEACVLKDRDAKKPLPRDQYTTSIHAEAATVGVTPDLIREVLSANQPTKLQQLSQEQMDNVKAQCLSELLEMESYFTEPKLAALVAHKLQGQATTKEILGTVDFIKQSLVELIPDARTEMLYSTRERIDLERQMIEDAQAVNTTFTLPKDVIEQVISKYQTDELRAADRAMSDEQADAVRHVLSSTSTMTVYCGAAGAGKSLTAGALTSALTTMNAIDGSNAKIIGCSLGWVAAKNLEKEAGIPSVAIEGLVRSLDKGARGEKGGLVLDNKTVILIDEAGMVGSVHGAKLLRYAREAGAKVIATGDLNQIPSVLAGSLLKPVVDNLGEARIDTVRRQHLVWTQGKGDGPAQFTDPKTGKPTFEVGHRLAVPKEISGQSKYVIGDIKKVDPQAGTLTVRTDAGKEFTFQPEGKWHRDGWARAAGMDIAKGKARESLQKFYDHDCIEITNRKSSAITALVKDYGEYRRHNPEKTTVVIANTRAEVRELNRRIHTVEKKLGNVTGKEYEIQVTDGSSDPYSIKLAVGSRIQLRASLKQDEIFNRYRGAIAKIEDDGKNPPTFHVRLDDGKEWKFSPGESDKLWDKERGALKVEPSYAVTTHASQGATLDAGWKLNGTNSNKELEYVGATRFRSYQKIFINREDAVETINSRLPDDQHTSISDISDREVLDVVGVQWSKSGIKHTAYDLFLERQRQNGELTVAHEAAAQQQSIAAQDAALERAQAENAKNGTKAAREQTQAAIEQAFTDIETRRMQYRAANDPRPDLIFKPKEKTDDQQQQLRACAVLQSDLERARRESAPESLAGVRNLSSVELVRFQQRNEVLLQDDAFDHVGQQHQGASGDAMRRQGDRSGAIRGGDGEKERLTENPASARRAETQAEIDKAFQEFQARLLERQKAWRPGHTAPRPEHELTITPKQDATAAKPTAQEIVAAEKNILQPVRGELAAKLGDAPVIVTSDREAGQRVHQELLQAGKPHTVVIAEHDASDPILHHPTIQAALRNPNREVHFEGHANQPLKDEAMRVANSGAKTKAENDYRDLRKTLGIDHDIEHT